MSHRRNDPEATAELFEVPADSPGLVVARARVAMLLTRRGLVVNGHSLEKLLVNAYLQAWLDAWVALRREVRK